MDLYRLSGPEDLHILNIPEVMHSHNKLSASSVIGARPYMVTQASLSCIGVYRTRNFMSNRSYQMEFALLNGLNDLDTSHHNKG
jgi:hypothetical protein